VALERDAMPPSRKTQARNATSMMTPPITMREWILFMPFDMTCTRVVEDLNLGANAGIVYRTN
jgi:hypothetical protein